METHHESEPQPPGSQPGAAPGHELAAGQLTRVQIPALLLEACHSSMFLSLSLTPLTWKMEMAHLVRGW